MTTGRINQVNISIGPTPFIVALEQAGAGCGIIKLLRLARIHAGIRLTAISFSNCARRQSIMQALISFQMK